MSDTPSDDDLLRGFGVDPDASDSNDPNVGDPEDPEVTLAAKLQAYYRSMEQEFDIEQRPELIDAGTLADTVKKQMIGHLPKAFKSLAYLSEHAKSEQVKLTASRFIIECSIGNKAMAPPGDPLESLLRSMTADRKD